MWTNLKKSARGTAVYAAVGYVVLVLLLTYPAIFHLQDRLIGNNIDNWIFYWNNWWLSQAIAAGKSWFFTPLLYFPQGTSLVAHSNSFLSSLLAWLVQPLVGPVAAFNLVWLWGLWLGAWGMFLLVRELTKQPIAAFAAGFVFAFAPYHLTQYMAHMHLGTIHWWPFYILFLWRSLRQPGWANAALAGLCLALTFWTGFQLAILLAIWTAVYLLWWGWDGRTLQLRQTAPKLLLLAGVAGLLSLPILWPVLADLGALSSRAADFDESIIKQTDLMAYVAPPTYQPLWGSAMVPIYQRFRVNQAYMPYLGGGVLLLCLLAVWKQWRVARFWVWSGLLWFVLSTGSKLRLNGTVYDWPTLPYSLIKSIFPISTIRTPDRFNLLLGVSTAVLVGLALAWLWPRRRGRGVVLLFGAVLLLDYLPAPLLMWELPPQSVFYETLAGEETAVGVVDFPMGYTISKLWLYYQTVHGQPIVEGHVSRYTAETYAFIDGHPLLRNLYTVGELPVYLPPEMFTAVPERVTNLGPALRQLEQAKVRYLLVHLPQVSPEQLAFFEAQLPLVPIFRDENLVVYDVTEPRPWRFQPEVPIAEGVEVVDHLVDLAETAESVQMELLVRLDSLAGVGQVCQVEMMGGTAVGQPVTLFAQDDEWQVGDLAHYQLTLPLPAQLAAGQHRLQLRCNSEAILSLPGLLVQPNAQVQLAGTAANVRLGQAIVLQDVRGWMRGSQLHLALRWFADQAPQQELKLFVHVVDANGTLVRQLDAVPCNWQCPTTGWQAGATILDEAQLELWGLPEGDYQILLGLYDAGSGERLPMWDEKGTAVPNNSFLLPIPITIFALP